MAGGREGGRDGPLAVMQGRRTAPPAPTAAPGWTGKDSAAPSASRATAPAGPADAGTAGGGRQTVRKEARPSGADGVGGGSGAHGQEIIPETSVVPQGGSVKRRDRTCGQQGGPGS